MPKNVWDADLFIIPSVEKYVLTENIALVSPEFRNAFASILVTDDGIVIDVKPVAPWKALGGMTNIPDWMITDFIPDPWNAFDPMLVTDDGILIDVRLVIPWKAFAPMLVTDDGIVIYVTPLASWKALAPILL